MKQQRGRVWLAVGVIGVLWLVAVIAACSDRAQTPDVRRSRDMARDIAVVTITASPINTATPAPRATLWSPMETAPPEYWGYTFSSGAAIATVAADCVTNQCWQWSASGGASLAIVRWSLPTPYVMDETPDSGFHIALDFRMKETPSSEQLILTGGGGGFQGPRIDVYPRASGTPNAYTLHNHQSSGEAQFVWDMSDDAWHHLEIYANQMPTVWAPGTPVAAPPLWLAVDGTPIPTPTGTPPMFQYLVDLTQFGIGEIFDNAVKFQIDNTLIESCLGDCTTATPQPVTYITVTVTMTPSPTPTPWGTAVWVCPTAVMTVDAQLGDWAAITNTLPLSASNAAYTWPLATPSVADLSAAFQCAHSSNLLYLNGVITDSVLTQDSAPIEDDAVTVQVDGWGDGWLRMRGDDHALVLAQDGRLRDFETLPISATLVTSTTVAGWQFELSIPGTILELPSLSRRLINLVLGLIDDDDGGLADQRMVAPTRAAGMD